MESSVRVNHFF